ncbi:glycosyltransferase family 4 protein [Halorussus salilacus]|uniref:glycosyltransferase family 4 protein n=1 Tax=Halorussus salilacus TaxID=2953750 RepID=UPI0020A0D153|nr:glycosyltransferase family 4 protein [Halorussus salilacus]USZ68051.1 glycosyltransferase family 4 protein [Halorussus salilacus]
MRVLQVTPRYPPRTGGVETHVAEIAERLVERGHEVTVLAADAGRGVPDRETRNGVEVRRFRGFAPGGAFHVAPGIARAVARADPDVVHAHNYHSLPVAFAALGASAASVLHGASDARFVVTPHYHGASADPVRDRLLSLYRPLGGWALRRADAVVAVSDWERRRLRADFGVEATVIPNGLDVSRFADATPEDRDRPYLLCVGRLEEYKGVQHAVRALADLPEYDLLVAGSGDYRDELERLAREAGVADRVAFLGYVESDRLPGLYAGAEAYLALSVFESYGMTVAEALASGTPCVVREAGALVDWTDRADCVGVESVAPEDVAAGVRAAVGRDAPDAALPTWDDVTERVLAVYR